MRELSIQSPDGQTKTIPLRGERMVLGRSSAVELSFPEDSGLSRQHLVLERDGNDWTIQDLGSKNGTTVNSIPLKARLPLKPGDRIAAGHLLMVYGGPGADGGPASGVEFYEGPETEQPTTSTEHTSLEGALSNQTMISRPGERGTKQVQALVRAGKELAASRPLNELFPLILDLSIDAVGAQRGVVLIQEGDQLIAKAQKGDGFRISSAVRDRVVVQKTSVLVKDAQVDEDFMARVSIVQQRVRSMMAVPLQTNDRIIGLIYVDSPFLFREFTKDDLSLLTVMANTAAIRIEHARLAEVEEAERRMARELDQAAEIQRGFLPQAPPEVSGAELAGYNSPCRTVGGDYYDFIQYADGRVGMVLGDVSGKGMPASLMMMGLQARVQVLAQEAGDLGALMNRLNTATCAHCPSNRFITFFLCVLNPASGELAYANAGHNPPMLVRRGGKVDMIEGGGPVLGILRVARYTESRDRMDHGDVLVLYSDGVTEAANPAQEEFGEERFAEVLRANRKRPAPEIVRAVTDALRKWANGAQQADDITLVVARRM